jgi:hypothetical protein
MVRPARADPSAGLLRVSGVPQEKARLCLPRGCFRLKKEIVLSSYFLLTASALPDSLAPFRFSGARLLDFACVEARAWASVKKIHCSFTTWASEIHPSPGPFVSRSQGYPAFFSPCGFTRFSRASNGEATERKYSIFISFLSLLWASASFPARLALFVPQVKEAAPLRLPRAGCRRNLITCVIRLLRCCTVALLHATSCDQSALFVAGR